MKIFRSILETKQGKFLVDAEHNGGELGLLNIHPVVDGIVWASLPLCQLENVGPLINEIKKIVTALP